MGQQSQAEKQGVACIVADRHPVIRDSLELLLQDDGYAVCGKAATGSEAIRLLDELRPGLAVLDLSLHDMSGVEVAREARRLGLDTTIVIHTAAIRPSHVPEALEAGVGAIALKAVPPDALLEAIAAARAGETYVDPAIGYRLPGPTC